MKRGTPSHPKVYALAARMNIPHALAVGYLELLWHFTARYAPQGDIGKFDDATIAKACSYQGDPSRLVSAMCAVGWLEVSPRCRLGVHDWHEHADETVRKSLQRKHLPFLTVTDSLSRQVPDSVETDTGQCRDFVATKTACLSQSHSLAIAPAESWTERLCELHPAPSDPRYPATFCTDNWLRLGEDGERFQEFMLTVERGLIAWCAHWALDGNRFATSLDKWLAGGGWKKPAPKVVSRIVKPPDPLGEIESNCVLPKPAAAHLTLPVGEAPDPAMFEAAAK